MTKFVESFATRQLLPWVSKACKTWGFAVSVENANIQGYLDNYFNNKYPDCSPYRYEPFPEPLFGFITVRQHEDVFSNVRGQEEDTLSYKEAYWTFPALRYLLTGGEPSPNPETIWVQPFSVCDNPLVMFGSREIWGADVMLSEIINDDTLSMNRLHLDVAVDGFRKFEPKARGERLATMHIQMADGVALDEGGLGAYNQRLVNFMSVVNRGPSPELATPSIFVPGGTTDVSIQNYVKQIRDIRNWDNAIYRAIVASKMTHAVTSLAFYPGERVELDLMWSATVKQLYTGLLGIKEADAVDGPPLDHAAGAGVRGSPKIHWDLKLTRMPVQLAYSFISDLTFEVTDTLYTYGALGAAIRRRASALKSNSAQATQSGQHSDAAQ